MTELKLIHRKRKLFARIIQYAFLGSLLMLLSMLIIKPEPSSNGILHFLLLIVGGTFVLTLLYLIFVSWFPIINEHQEQGILIIDHYELRTIIHNEESVFPICDYQQLKLSIYGFHGQDKSSIGTIHIADGTQNYLTLTDKNRSSIKFEFLLENQRSLNTLIKYVEAYRPLTNVSIK